MDIQDSLEMCKLLDTYGELLTSRQLMICKSYYFDNLSLAEVGDELGISRQAVNDCLEKSKKSLKKFEQVIGKIKLIEYIRANLSDIANDSTYSQLKPKIKNILDSID